MAKITINREKCKGCLLCVAVCHKSLIKADAKLNKKGVKPAVFQDNGTCLGCMLCAIMCPDCCIEVYK